MSSFITRMVRKPSLEMNSGQVSWLQGLNSFPFIFIEITFSYHKLAIWKGTVELFRQLYHWPPPPNDEICPSPPSEVPLTTTPPLATSSLLSFSMDLLVWDISYQWNRILCEGLNYWTCCPWGSHRLILSLLYHISISNPVSVGLLYDLMWISVEYILWGKLSHLLASLVMGLYCLQTPWRLSLIGPLNCLKRNV